MVRRNFMKTLSAVAVTAAFGLNSLSALAAETIKVGVLHSLSGTMAISETALKETVLMAIDEINSKGGVLGKKLEPVVVDPASNWPLFAEKARQLLSKDKVAVTFGCWTSVSRKSVLPVYKELNGLLFYPVQYEGEELEYNVFYTGAAPNQQAIPAVEYLMSKDGGEAKRFVLLGTDYVYPRTTNKILRAFLKSKGVADADIMEEYTPFGHSDYQTIIAKIKKFSSEGKKTAVVSTINGDSNVPFYKELGNAGLKATECAGRRLLGRRGRTARRRHQAAGRPSGRMELLHVAEESREREVHQAVQGLGQVKNKLPNAGTVVTNDPMEATYIGVYMWKQAVEKARSTDVDKVISVMAGQTFKAPSGFHDQDGRKEPPSAQAGVHRRDQGRRAVQRRLEDAGSGQGSTVEPVHPGNDKKKDRAGRQVSIGIARAAAAARGLSPLRLRSARGRHEGESMRTSCDYCLASACWASPKSSRRRRPRRSASTTACAASCRVPSPRCGCSRTNARCAGRLPRS
jgi:urea transport system substrate-binding protein